MNARINRGQLCDRPREDPVDAERDEMRAELQPVFDRWLQERSLLAIVVELAFALTAVAPQALRGANHAEVLELLNAAAWPVGAADQMLKRRFGPERTEALWAERGRAFKQSRRGPRGRRVMRDRESH